MKLTLLQTAVRSINDLRIVETLDEFQSTTYGQERGLAIELSESWDGVLEFSFEITGLSDANLAAHVEDQKSVSGWSVFLNSAPI